ncbi:MAG: hypothetical protein EZS28_043831 [Streblomastix strix]|uniref:Uncharacterized protein n=1 Tax=Streblomastix strix TaxID=222440 RepID=A0A5J4TRW2_9EUKA|nr:MAG: hypothetical protein EZS28_043831 [Streblomastix strix]
MLLASQAKNSLSLFDCNCCLQTMNDIASRSDKKNAAKDIVLNTATEALSQDNCIVPVNNKAACAPLEDAQCEQIHHYCEKDEMAHQQQRSSVSRPLCYINTNRNIRTVNEQINNTLTKLHSPDIQQAERLKLNYSKYCISRTVYIVALFAFVIIVSCAYQFITCKHLIQKLSIYIKAEEI